MKKIYLSILALSALNVSLAQRLEQKRMDLQTGKISENTQATSEEKAEGDVIWYNTMSNTNNWVASVLNGTQGPELGWQWSPTNTGATSLTSWAFTSRINSTTKTTGYFLAKNGDPNAGNQDVDAELILTFDSTFNLSTYPNVNFTFQQYGALFIENQVVEATVDNGTTWVEIGNNNDMGALTANGGSPYPNNPAGTRVYNVNNAFPGGTDFSAVKFRFRVNWPSNSGANGGIMYGWFVDDVKLVEGSSDDLRLYQAFNTIGAQKLQLTKIPAGQVTASVTMDFGVKVKNMGPNAQDASVTITNPGAVGTTNVSSIAGFTQDSLVYAGPYAVPTTAGTYNFLYTATSSNNTLTNTGDDTKTLPFEVSTNVFATDAFTGNVNSVTGDFYGWSSISGDQEIGNLFEVFVNGITGAIEVGVSNVGASSQVDFIGRELKGKIYDASGTDPVLLAETDVHNIVTADFGKLVRLYFNTPVTIEAGKVYLVTASSFENQEVPVMFSGFLPEGLTFGVDNSTATPSIISLIGTDGLSEAPVVRMNTTDYTSISELAQIKVSVYPNPSTGLVTVSTENNVSNTISVTDVTGKVVLTKVANGTTTIDLSANGTGIYMVRVSNENGSAVERVIVK